MAGGLPAAVVGAFEVGVVVLSPGALRGVDLLLGIRFDSFSVVVVEAAGLARAGPAGTAFFAGPPARAAGAFVPAAPGAAFLLCVLLF